MFMFAKFLFWLTRERPCRLIYQRGKPYLERYFLFKFMGVHFWLHRFVSGERDRGLHDHPFKSLAVVLCGSYVEKRLMFYCLRRGQVCITRKMGGWRRLNFLGLNTQHQIIDAQPETWTLFMRGERVKIWGFYELVKHNQVRSLVWFSNPFNAGISVDSQYEAWPKAKDAGREWLDCD